MFPRWPRFLLPFASSNMLKLQLSCMNTAHRLLFIFVDVCLYEFQSCHCIFFFTRHITIKGSPCLGQLCGFVGVIICVIHLKSNHYEQSSGKWVFCHFDSTDFKWSNPDVTEGQNQTYSLGILAVLFWWAQKYWKVGNMQFSLNAFMCCTIESIVQHINAAKTIG